ncbi:MAG: ExeA family protein [Candidatus Binatia bacterium]
MYNRHFGFLESPFGMAPDPRFFYGNPVYLEAYANLRYGIEAKKGFIAITGEVGTGKTMLLRKLMRSFEDTIDFVFIFNTNLTFNDLLRAILHDLGLDTQGKDKLAMFDALNTYLVEQVKKDHIVCVLIDEVQNLSDESLEGLRLLSNLETDNEKLLQIVMMGQPEFKAKLKQSNLRQLKQRIALQFEIAPLTDEEVGTYINFRLQSAGCKRKDLFHPDAVQKIVLYSKGIPRLINVICDNALITAFAASQKTVSATMIQEVADDLDLDSKTRPVETTNVYNALPSDTGGAHLIREAPNRGVQQNLSRPINALVGTFLVILVVVLISVVTDPQSFFSLTQKILKSSKDNSIKQVLAAHQDASPQMTNAEADNAGGRNPSTEFKWNQPVIIQYGSTIYEIANHIYGSNAILGMDLIKDFNPQIKDLNWVSAGHKLILPALTRETLVRKHGDGSYRFIVASYIKRTEADELASRIAQEGYQVIITRRKVSNNLLLHRLEIDGLKTLEEVTESLKTGLKKKWFTLSG